MSNIAIVGTGYVGLVTGACMAELGHRVRCIDIDAAKIASLQKGQVPIFEPGLQELTQRNLEAGRLSFHLDYAQGLHASEFVFVCVDTPTRPDGRPVRDRLEAAIQAILDTATEPVTLILKSTVPVGTGAWIRGKLARGDFDARQFAIVSCPEFLSEGSAIQDFMHPDRIVLGCMDRRDARQVAALFRSMDAPLLVTDLKTAEMIKFASNAYLATRITFVNHVARICEKVGVSIDEVTRGMALDARIGPQFLKAGLGFGGSCFPKDVRALNYLARAEAVDYDLLAAVLKVNGQARLWAVEQVADCLGAALAGASVGVLGLTFKPGTDDLREAPALDIVAELQARGAQVRVYDPMALARVQALPLRVDAAADPYALAQDADALIVCTEWDEFRGLDMPRVASLMRRRILVDGRNVYDPFALQALGFVYRGVGRGHVAGQQAAHPC